MLAPCSPTAGWSLLPTVSRGMTASLLHLTPWLPAPDPGSSHGQALAQSGALQEAPAPAKKPLLLSWGVPVHAVPQTPLPGSSWLPMVPGYPWFLADPVPFPLPPSALNKPLQFSVLLGIWQLANPGQRSQQVGISWVYPHPVYSWKEGSRADIALVRLEHPIQFSERILPICLPDYSVHLPPNTNCWIAGWGSVHDGGVLLHHQVVGDGWGQTMAGTQRHRCHRQQNGETRGIA